MWRSTTTLYKGRIWELRAFAIATISRLFHYDDSWGASRYGFIPRKGKVWCDRAKVLDAIEIHLRYEPEKLSKSRIKRLKAIAQPQYRLRVDDLRVFYDVIYTVDTGTVEILAVKEKAEAIKWLAEYGRPEL